MSETKSEGREPARQPAAVPAAPAGEAEVRSGGRRDDAQIRSTLKEALSGTYRILSRIAEGGMGDLYLATHEELGGKWAVKVLGRDLLGDSDVVERFVTEARIGAELQHPNIVKVFHIGRAGKFRYLVMNYVEGEDLAARIARSSPLPESEIVSIAVQICRALECAHDHEVVHRDLKPSNIHIDNYGTVLVLDFGIARARDIALKTRTAVGERLGTPLYMSPEQVRGATADGRSDLYSLGILMYEMATGSNPFDAESPHAVYLKQINEVPPPVSRVNSAISRKLSRILLRLLEKEPEKRFQSALEVLTAFESAGLARKITTPPPSKIQESDEREGVLRKRPPTVSEEAFSADHKKILEHVNGSRSASDVLRLTSLDSKRFQRALNDLVRREAVSVLESNKKSPAAAAGAAAAEPVGERFSPGFGRSAIAMVAAILILLSVFAARDVPVVLEPVALTVDASPYAAVNIVDASNRTVFRDETPFVAALPPGDYSLQFTYDSRQVTRSVALVDATPGEVRHEFWEGVDVEDLLTQILDQ